MDLNKQLQSAGIYIEITGMMDYLDAWRKELQKIK